MFSSGRDRGGRRRGSASAARPGCSGSCLRRLPRPREFRALGAPVALHHLRQAVDHDVEERADAQPEGERNPGKNGGLDEPARGPASTSPLRRAAELEDRQVHRDHHAADQRAEHHHDDRLHQAGQRLDRVVHLGLEEVGDLAQHGVERAGFLADRAPSGSPCSGTRPTFCIATVRLVPVDDLALDLAWWPCSRRSCPRRRPPNRALRPAARRRRTWSTACASSARSWTCGAGRRRSASSASAGP